MRVRTKPNLRIDFIKTTKTKKIEYTICENDRFIGFMVCLIFMCGIFKQFFILVARF